MIRDGLPDELRSSSKRIGQLYPILLDKHGNIIDGEHRFAADRNWPTVKLDYIESDEQRLIAKLVGNACRRRVSAGEKNKLLKELGEVYLRKGIKPGRLAHKLASETGMSYRWVMKYLPDNLKMRPGIGGPWTKPHFEETARTQCGVAQLATEIDYLLLQDPKERILTVKDYSNTDFVHVILEKEFYSRVERIALSAGVTADVLISSILFSTIKKLENMFNQDLPQTE